MPAGSPVRGIAAVRAHLAKLPPQRGLTFEEWRANWPRAPRARASDVTLEVWDTMVHVWHWFLTMLDEGQAAADRIGAFVRERAR